jgi:hypothetical protein
MDHRCHRPSLPRLPGRVLAVNFGHGHPLILAAAHRQLDAVTLVSRAFQHDQFAAFCEGLAALAGKDMVLPMNTGAEAVESGIKVARKWGYEVKGVPADQATIVVAGGNFHGRTVTIVSFSDDPDARDNFGPYTPGFRTVPYGDAEAVAGAIDETTVAVLVEPIQGEAGVIVPPADYLPRLRELCTTTNTLLIADEIQSVSAGRAPRSPVSTSASCPTSTCSARRSAAVSCRCRPSSPMRTSSVCSSPVSTAPRSAAIRWPAPWGVRSSTCWRPATSSGGRQSWGSGCTAGWASSWARA